MCETVSQLPRVGSLSYWDSDAWDPDSRVYVAADMGYDTHRLAVQPENNTASHAGRAPFGEPILPSPSSSAPGSPKALKRVSSNLYWEAFDAGHPDVGPMRQGHLAHLGRENPSGPPDVLLAMSMGQSMGQTAPSTFRSDDGRDPSRLAFLQTGGSSNYWGTSFSGSPCPSPGPTAPSARATTTSRSRLGAETDAVKEKVDEPASPQKSGLGPRVNSDAYWGADQWDPDNRIYVGAEAGLENHMVAVLEKGSDKLSRAWTGGLVSDSFGLSSGEVGMPFDLVQAVGSALTLKELYEIEPQTVGSGAFAVVRPAKHIASGTQCVVKMINKSHAGDPYRRNVERGLYDDLLGMTKKAPHENVVNYFDFLESSDNYYVVMESLEGRELLEQVEADFPLTENYCEGIMRQAFVALKHLHDVVGICHRDVKLSNFCFRGSALGAQESLVLLDFGFSSRLSDDWDGNKCGTKMFMAPEVMAGSVERASLAAVDLWSAGVIFYVLLTGDSPVQEHEMSTLAALDVASQELMDRAFTVPQLGKVSAEALDLLRGLLHLESRKRLTAAQALAHTWFHRLKAADGEATCSGKEPLLEVPKESYQRARSMSCAQPMRTA